MNSPTSRETSAKTGRLRDQLFRGQDIYAGVAADPAKVDMQGWGSDHGIFAYCIERLQPKLIIEVGSWKGRSAINMARAMQDFGMDGEILCIDTWLGSPEHWLADGAVEAWRSSLGIVHGYPTLYNTFLNNVIASQCERIITPLPLPSESAFFVLQRLGVKAPIIYIDAGHEYESVSRDIALYWQLLAPDGVMILDNYLTFPGVTRAATEFALREGLPLIGEPGKAVLTRNNTLSIASKIIVDE